MSPFECLAKLAPFDVLPADTLSAIAESCRRVNLQSKQMIFLEGEDAEAAYAVCTGRIGLLKSSPNGKELIVELVPAGELLGVVAFLGARPYPLTARALCDSELVVIPRSAVIPHLDRHPSLLAGFMELISGRMQITQNLARALSHDRVETRIASLLIALIPKAGAAGTRVSLAVSRQDLADMAGTTIESASRVVKSFERDGWVDASSVGSLDLLNLPALRRASIPQES